MFCSGCRNIVEGPLPSVLFSFSSAGHYCLGGCDGENQDRLHGVYMKKKKELTKKKATKKQLAPMLG